MAAVVSLNTYPAPRRVPISTRPARSHRDAAVYRRRRFAAAAVGFGILLAAGQAGAALGGSTLAPVERRPQVVTVVVDQGDTLWSIAERLAPDTDTREVVDAIVEARGTASIMPGETITWLEH
ncbi:MAG: hypothetical protein SGJ13_04110 [Actinomycetota bacterium]|nr:hypothetical protein [Actinomycetota bacterium]